jgi:hypothetical protein
MWHLTAAPKYPAFDFLNVDRQMASMATAGELALERLKPLAASHRVGALHNCFLLFRKQNIDACAFPLDRVPRLKAGRMICRIPEFSEHKRSVVMFSEADTPQGKTAAQSGSILI